MKALRIVSDGEERQTDRDINSSLTVQSFQCSPRHIWRGSKRFTLLVLYETGNAGHLDKACLDVLSPDAA